MRATSAFLLLVIPALAGSARAQNYPGAHPNIRTVAVVNHQRDMYNYPDDRIALVHLDSAGAHYDVFNEGGSGAWSGFQTPTPSGPWSNVRNNGSLGAVADMDYGDGSLFWFPGTDGALQAQFPFFVVDPSFWVNNSPVTLTLPSMFPMSSISYVQPDGMPRGSVFGLGGDGHSLRELWLYDNQWSFFDHGAPSSAQLFLSPSSAVATSQTIGVADVLVAMSDANGDVWVQSTLNNQGWTPFQRLGSFGAAHVHRPIMVAHDNNGTPRVHVFLPVRNSKGGTWNMWEIYGDRGPTGYTWSTWRSYPGPTGFNGFSFDLTSAIAWRPGGVLKVNIFGTTDFGKDSSGCIGGDIVMFTWDGSTWGWSPTAVTPAGCDHFQTTSAVFIDSGYTERGSVYFEDAKGKVHELASPDGNRDLSTWTRTNL